MSEVEKAVEIRSAMVTQSAASLAKSLDAEIKRALDAALPGWTVNDLVERCTLRSPGGVNVWETFCLDGEPLLGIGPIESKTEERDGGYFLTFSRSIKRFSAPVQL